VCAVCTVSLAGIPEPDAILYGTITIDGQVQTAEDDVTVIARVDVDRPPLGNFPGEEDTAGQEVGRYHMGDSATAGDLYVLRIRLESLVDGSVQSENAAVVGQTAQIFLRQGTAPEEHALDFLISDRGIAEEHNLGSGACVMISASPPNCAIDAGQPSEPNGSNPAGLRTVQITFGGSCNLGTITPGDFEVTVTPAGAPPTIADVVAVGNDVTLVLGERIALGAWTCFQHTGTATQTCVGWLPSDVNGDGTSSAVDILAIIDNLNGQVIPPYDVWQCDVDRSGACVPADILRVIDLLNGADTYDSWLNVSIPACPSM
jgi:hypothetical protein